MEPPAPSATKLGPYRLQEQLGAGAMGTVYLAEGDEGPVALKVIHPHLLERAGYFKRFQREAGAGRRVEHENVVRTIDSDLLMVEGEPHFFLVMEYVRGRTLRTLLREKGPLPEALVREIGRQVAAGLAAIHAAGVVHRDVKPENVLITDDHRVRIMDLGVARMVDDAARLTDEGHFAGSLGYAAPEQFRSGEVGPAADLYALGVLLYELVVGENPFRHDEGAAAMKAHLEEVPPPLDERDPDVSLLLSELVTTLLEKRPARRLESAEAVHTVLEAGEEAAWWAGRRDAARRRASHVPRVPVRRDTKLYGRDEALERIRRSWTRAEAGEGNAVWLDGEAGIGKSRVVDAFLQELVGVSAHVLYGSYPPSGGLGGLSDAVLGKFGEADLEGALEPYLGATPSLVPAFSALLRHQPPPAGAVALQGDALDGVCVNLMRALAREKPLLWVVEDLHFADVAVRKLALSLARAVEGHRVLLLLTGRPGVPRREAAAFDRLRAFQRVELSRLGAREVVLLLQDALRSPALADKLGARIALASDGVPFFVFEMIRGLKEGLFVTELPDGSYVETKEVERIEVPPAVRDLVEARLSDLSRDERGLLDVGAVEGFTFDPDLLARVREQRRVEVLEMLADLERRHGIVRAFRSRYRFDHHQIQEVLLAEMPEALSREYHALLADAYSERQRIGGRTADGLSGEACWFLAHHRLRGRNPREGLDFLHPALRHLSESYRLETALELARCALSEPGLLEGSERGTVLLNRASRLSLLGRSEEALPHAEEARSCAQAEGDVALAAAACRVLGWALHYRCRYDEAESTLQEAIALARRCGDAQGEGEAEGLLGAMLVTIERDDEAVPHLKRKLDIARDTGDRRAEAQAKGNLSLVLYDQGRLEEARQGQLEVVALVREIGDRMAEAQAVGNLGLISADLGQGDDAMRYLEEQLRIAREIGHRRSEANARANLVEQHLARGSWTAAREQLDRVLALARDFGDAYLEWVARWNLGEWARATGRSQHAREHFTEALETSRVLGSKEGEAELRANLGRLAVWLGDAEGAAPDLLGARDLAREIGNARIESLALLGLGAVAELEGAMARSRAFVEEAVARARTCEGGKAALEALLELGALAAEAGEGPRAAAILSEVLEIAESCRADGVRTVALAYLAVVTRDPTEALAALAQHGPRLSHLERLTVHAKLWQITSDAAHLRAAHGLLAEIAEHAPNSCRVSVVERVPLHRDIERAWSEQRPART